MFRVALLQSPAELSGPAERLDWLESTLMHVADQKPDLVLLPELFLTGYNVGTNLSKWAEEADGPSSKRIASLAARHRTAIHYGYSEESGGRLFNSAQCVTPDGDRLGGHRKLILPPGKEADHFTQGTGCTLFSYRGLTIATLICYDIEFPETARYVASLGAQVLLVPTALGDQWGWVADTMVPTRAYENGIFLAYCNHSGSDNGLRFLGRSFVSAPDGRELVRAGHTPEALIANIDVSLVAKAQARLPYLRDIARITLREGC